MTLLEIVIKITHWQDAFIILGFFAVALQALRQVKPTTPNANSIRVFVVILALCAITGYGTHLFSRFDITHYIRAVLVFPLLIATWYYIWRSEVVHIIEIIKKDADKYDTAMKEGRDVS